MSGVGEVNAMSTLARPEEWFFEAMTWGQSDAGEVVNPRTALTHGPVWQAVNILAGDVGQLPLHVYQKSERKRTRLDKHPVEWLLANEPNPYQTPAVWKETMMAWALLWGNGCSLILRDGAGRPSMLVPLMPDRTRPLNVDGEWWIQTDFGDGKQIPLPYEDVFHVRGLATDGFWGVSAIEVAKNVIGGGMALRKYQNNIFKNGARPGGALTSLGKEPNAEVRREYRENLEKIHAGANNSGKWLMLWNGTTFTPMSMSNVDAQTMQLMDLDREFVASLFNLPPYKLGAMKNSSTRANMEQQGTDYLNTSLSRHLNKIREEGERKLFTLPERRQRRIYLKWIVEAFLRGDLQARGAYYSQAKTGEWMTTNEIRELEDMDAIEGGDELRNPAINPAEQQKSDEKPPVEPESDETSKNLSRGLIGVQVSAMLETEAKALIKASGPDGARNFCRWASNYYEAYPKMARNFLELPTEIAIRGGFEAANWLSAVELHARDSLQAVLGLTDLVGKSGLAGVIEERADVVRGLTEQLTQTVLGGK